jgi:hypothetical protein
MTIGPAALHNLLRLARDTIDPHWSGQELLDQINAVLSNADQAPVPEPAVAARLRSYEGRSMDERRHKPINPCITAREAIELADWIQYLRGDEP